MATPSDIDALVGKVAGLYARTDAWKVRQAKGWRDTFRSDAIGDLRAAVERWIEDHDDKPPTVAQLLHMLREGAAQVRTVIRATDADIDTGLADAYRAWADGVTS